MLRLFSLLLSLCVLTGAIGVPTAAWQCGAAETNCAVSLAAEPVGCCDDAVGLSATATARATDEADDCCSVTVAYDHVLTESVGPILTLDWPAPAVWLPATVAVEWGTWRGSIATRSAAFARWFAADSGPPGRVVGWALVVALHQLRN